MKNRTISRICAEARKRAGIPQTYVADYLNTTQQAISNFECGRSFSSRLFLLYFTEILSSDDLDEIKGAFRNAEKNNRRNSSNGSSKTPPFAGEGSQKVPVSGIFGGK
jgi:transcriptional regulator with XRE-family HTH domain